MSKYTRVECDRCGVSEETTDGIAPPAEGWHLYPGVKPDLCPACVALLEGLKQEHTAIWSKRFAEWMAEGRAAAVAAKESK